MYLKNIKAHGFKSFADKINIELNSKITGIVGPNGSGKSNVVDAVRWVLGEQSVKSLRGDGLMSDVIFSGSKSRNPLNVASVTLVFDNTDNYLPVPYTEVSIKRRLYKDGTNEYYLNEEKVRLKDIISILLDSGIAKESFNIISQGKIEEILNSKPVDRRVIFEEAAGVLKYKRRKEDALRKLDKTHDNMNRVNDIIHELEKQVEPLKEQKEKALEYIKNKEELQNIEVALVTNDITNINYVYQDKKGMIDKLNNEIMSMQTTNVENETKIEEYKLKIIKIDKQIKETQESLLTKTTEVEQINSQKAIILERQKYNVDDTKLHDNIINLKESKLKLETNIEKQKQEINDLELNNNKLQEKINLEQTSIDKAKKIKEQYNYKLTNMLKQENILKNEINNLQESIDNNSTIPYSVKSILDNPKLRGIHNVIGSLIDNDLKYSTAISTSLGASSSYIVVDDEICAKEAINYLKINSLGRATFFPLNIIKPKNIDLDTLNIINKEPGFIDIASNLTNYNETYKNIILNQLGNIIIVDNLDSANKISKLINYKYRIVTLDGEQLHVGGSLTGGINKTRNIITDKLNKDLKQKELEKLEEELKTLEQQLNVLDNKIKEHEDKLYLINKDKLEQLTYLQTKQSNLSEMILNLGSINNEIEGTNSIINKVLSNEEELIMNKYYEALKEKDQIGYNLEKLNKEKQELNEELNEFEFSLKRENSLFNTKNKELKDLEIEVNRYDVKLDNLLNILTETYNMTYEKASNLYHLELDPKEARIKVNNLKRILKELEPVNLTAPEEYDKVSERYLFLIKQRDDLVNAENTLLDIITEMDQVMIKEFTQTFKIVQENFTKTFKELFKGGNAELRLTDEDNILETGIEIIASPPGKKLTSISLLSGGEKTFTAISLLFAILKSRSVPFCILDEVEAALDEANVASFGEYITNLKDKTQFILITHKKKTMEYADTLYGITMQESGVSKLVSVKLEEIGD